MNKINKVFLIFLSVVLIISFVGPSLVSAKDGIKADFTNLSTDDDINQALISKPISQPITLIESPINPGEGEVQPAWAWLAKKALLNAMRYGGITFCT